MDFFGAQDRAKANTFKLVILFILAVIVLCFGMFLIVNTSYVYATKDTEELGVSFKDFLNPDILLYSVVGTLAIILLAMATKVASLSGGGEKVATMLGGMKVNPATSNQNERQLLNVVEEMAIASGVPTPDVYVMPEESINAFAAGTRIEDAAIGVTKGCIEKLTRDELQGVIAHEFSHILNDDMKMNIKLMGIVFGIMVIAIIGRYLIEIGARSGSVRSSDKDKSGLALLGIGLTVFILGSAGLFFSRWIKSSISRQREYLADASAVQFTRNPEGIAGALKKIGGNAHKSHIGSSAAEEASHMFFGNALKVNLMFSTHPPLEDRITRIDPKWDGKFSEVADSLPEPEVRKIVQTEKPKDKPLVNIPGLPGQENSPIPGGLIVGAAILDETGRKNMANAVGEVETIVGNPSKLQLDYAKELREKLPDSLVEEIHQPMGAMATIYALLLDSKDPEIHKSQMTHIETKAPKGVASEVKKVEQFTSGLDHQFLLPLAELAAPSLRDLSPDQYTNFKELTNALIEEDRSIDLFEYSLEKMLESSLDVHFGLKRKQSIQYYSPIGVKNEIQVLISCLAYHGHEAQEEAINAFNVGLSSFSDLQGFEQMNLLGRDLCSLADVDKAIKKINTCSLPVKKRIVQASGRTIAADGEIRRVEAELIRSICYSFGCPVPPFVG